MSSSKMEVGQTGSKTASSALRSQLIDISEDKYPNPSQDKVLETLDIYDSVTVGVDWLEATKGKPITKTQYKNLQRSGYVSAGVDEIARTFGSWYYFSKFSVQELKSRDKLKAQRQAVSLRAIEEEVEYGLFPKELLRQSAGVEYCRIKDRGSEQTSRKLDKHYLSDERALDKEILKRHAKYTLINHLFEKLPPGSPVSDERIVNICIGFTQRSGKPLSGFFSVLKNSNSSLDDYEIDQAMEELGIYDYLVPEARSAHLQKLLEIGNSSFKNPAAVIFAGTHATRSYLHWQKTKHQLEASPEQLVGEALKKLETEDKRPHELYGWSRAECIEYGAWLVGLVQNVTGEPKINASIINRADEMGYGLGSHRLIKRFGSLAKFYVELKQVVEAVDAKAIGQFKEYNIADFAQAVSELGKELGRKPTEEDINNRASRDPTFPSSAVMVGEGLTLRQIMDKAGWPDIYSWDLVDHEKHGVKFMFANHGEPPTQLAWDYLSKNKRGPSASLMRYKYENGFSEFKKRVQSRYKAELVKHLAGEPSLADEANDKALKVPNNLNKPKSKLRRVQPLPYRTKGPKQPSKPKR